MYVKANVENYRKSLLIYLHNLIWELGKISLSLSLIFLKKNFLSIDSSYNTNFQFAISFYPKPVEIIVPYYWLTKYDFFFFFFF